MALIKGGTIMKYFRAKDGIYIQCKFKGYENYYCLPRNTNITKKEDLVILKESNNIDELCDELIIKNPNNDGDFYRKVFVYEGAWKNILNEKHAKHCTNRDIYEHDVEIFGAIWVIDSNGVPTLKPVAKMNDKGELELL